MSTRSTARPAADTPSLDTAFATLCTALLAHLGNDLVQERRVRQAQAFYAAGALGVAWTSILVVLEAVLDTPIRAH